MENKKGYAGWMDGTAEERLKAGCVGMDTKNGWAVQTDTQKEKTIKDAVDEITAFVQEDVLGYIDLKAGTKYVAEEDEVDGDGTTAEWKDLNLALAKAIKAEMQDTIDKIENGNW